MTSAAFGEGGDQNGLDDETSNRADSSSPQGIKNRETTVTTVQGKKKGTYKEIITTRTKTSLPFAARPPKTRKQLEYEEFQKRHAANQARIALLNQPPGLPESADSPLAVAPKGLFVVEGRVNKDGTARPVGILYTPQGGSGDKPTWMDNSFSLDQSQNRRSNEKDKKSGAIRSKNWHKLVDKRVEMLITPDGQLKEWKTISTARRMGRRVKKFFGGGRGLFKGSRKKVTEAEGE